MKKKKQKAAPSPPPPMVSMTTRDFRAKMGEHLQKANPIRLGTQYRTSALVVPIPNSNTTWSDSPTEINAAKRAAVAALDELIDRASK